MCYTPYFLKMFQSTCIPHHQSVAQLGTIAEHKYSILHFKVFMYCRLGSATFGDAEALPRYGEEVGGSISLCTVVLYYY